MTYDRRETVEYRVSSRIASCRVCDKSIMPKTEKMVTWYSFRNRGQNIHICTECVLFLQELVKHGS